MLVVIMSFGVDTFIGVKSYGSFITLNCGAFIVVKVVVIVVVVLVAVVVRLSLLIMVAVGVNCNVSVITKINKVIVVLCLQELSFE